MRHGDESTAAQIDSRSVPSSMNVALGADYRFVIDVFLDADLKKRLRVTVFGPSSASTNPSLPAGGDRRRRRVLHPRGRVRVAVWHVRRRCLVQL